MYKMNFPTKGDRRQCPVDGCPGVSETRAAMRVHFVHRHVHDTVVILEEGNPPPTTGPPVRPSGLQVAPIERLPGDLQVAPGAPW